MKHLFALLLAGFALEAQGQVIAFDRKTGQYSSGGVTVGNPELQRGNSVSYWLVNVNPFAQKVVINNKMYTLTVPIPDQLAKLFSIKAEAQKELNNTDDQVEEMNKVKSDIIAGAAAPKSLTTAMEQLVDSCENYYATAKKIDEALFWKEQLLGIMATKNHNTHSKMVQALTVANIDSALMENLRQDLSLFDINYHKAENQYRKAITEAQNAGQKDKAALMRNALQQIQKDYLALEKKYKQTLNDLKQLFADATNQASYVVKSSPLKLEGAAGDADEVSYDITVGENSYTDVFSVRGGWKIDYSVGAVLNYISDKTYFLDSGGKLQEQNKGASFNAVTPTVASMLHIYKRRSGEVAYAGTFGINAGFKELTDIKLGFLVGASAIVGRSQKFILSTGLSYLQVDRLKEAQYQLNTVYDGVKDFKIDGVIERVLRPSWFLAFSLNISRRTVIKPTP